MPTELFRVDSEVHWKRTTIRRGVAGLETELLFDVTGQSLSVTMDSMPREDFLIALLEVESLVIQEVSNEERGWVEPGRYRILINEEDYLDHLNAAIAIADQVRWDEFNPA